MRPLRDDILERLSEELAADDMKRLAPLLGVSQQEVKTRYAAHCTDRTAVTAANHDILKDWLKRQNSREKAYDLMGKALIRAGLNLIAWEVLNYPPVERTNELKSGIKRKRQRNRDRNQRKKLKELLKQHKINGLPLNP